MQLSPRHDIKQIHLIHIYDSFLEYYDMETSDLRIFLSVAECRSFSLAAEQLHMTQPAVSKRIAGLEHGLGLKLFDRIGRGIDLTEAGRRLLPRARSITREMADIQRSMHSLGGEVSGPLLMGTSHHIGLRRLPGVLSSYIQRYPEVALDIRFLGSEAACAAIEHGELELAIVTLPTRQAPRLQSQLLWQDPLRLVVAPEHPLAAKSGITIDELLQHPAVLTTEETFTREILERALGDQAGRLRVSLQTNYLETLMMMARIGLGWTMLPETMLEDGELVPLEIEGVELVRLLGAVTHRERTLSNAARAMLEACKKSLSGEAAS